MKKRIERQLNSFLYNGEPVRITLGTLILICLCILLLIIATFTQITLHHPYFPPDTFQFLGQNPQTSQIVHHFTKTYRYIPQIPMVFFIVALLGRKFGILTILLYITLGMFFPIFALGGGITYMFEYGFGYILGYIPAIFFTGTLLKIKTDFLRIVLMAALGVLAIHILGILYMLFIATLKHAPMELVWGWITSQSGIQVFYDVFFTVLGIYLGRWARRILWIVMC